MKNGKDIPKNTSYNQYREKLIRLYKAKKIDINDRGWSLKVAKDMFDMGILRYEDYAKQEDSYGKDITKYKKNDSIQRTLRQHIQIDYTGDLSMDWLKHYCEYFGCSSDYLLGYIDNPIHSKYDDVPLRFETIQALNRIRKNYLKNGYWCFVAALHQIKKQPYQTMDMLDFVLQSPHFEDMLYSLENYFKPEYNIPVFYIDSNQAPDYKGYHVPHNPIHEVIKRDKKGKIILDNNYMPQYDRYLPLAKNDAFPSDNHSYQIDDNFVENISMLEIQKEFSNMKQDYIKAQSKAPDAKQKTKATKQKENRKNEKAKQ